MADPSLPLQKAVHDALRADATLTALVGTRVYDSPPKNAATPYVSIGEDQILGERADCYDGSEFFLTIHAFSTEPGYPQVKRISSAIRSVLHGAELTVDNFRLVDMAFDDLRHFRDPDGLTAHAVISIRGFVEPVE